MLPPGTRALWALVRGHALFEHNESGRKALPIGSLISEKRLQKLNFRSRSFTWGQALGARNQFSVLAICSGLPPFQTVISVMELYDSFGYFLAET